MYKVEIRFFPQELFLEIRSAHTNPSCQPNIRCCSSLPFMHRPPLIPVACSSGSHSLVPETGLFPTPGKLTLRGPLMSSGCSPIPSQHTWDESCCTSICLFMHRRPQSDSSTGGGERWVQRSNVSCLSDTPHSSLLLLPVAQTHMLRRRNTRGGPLVRWVARYHPDT